MHELLFLCYVYVTLGPLSAYITHGLSFLLYLLYNTQK